MDESFLVNQLRSGLSLAEDNYGQVLNGKTNNNFDVVKYPSNTLNKSLKNESAFTNNKMLSSKIFIFDL